MIFQNPSASLNPVFRVGDQMLEAMALHLPEGRAGALRGAGGRDAGPRGDPSPRSAARDYPHQLSGRHGAAGDDRRWALVRAEPAHRGQADHRARRDDPGPGPGPHPPAPRELGWRVLVVSHDLGVVSQICDRVLVMYAGRGHGGGAGSTCFRAPAHPYTRGLIDVPARARGDGRQRPMPARGPARRALPAGCPFPPRCPVAEPGCAAATCRR